MEAIIFMSKFVFPQLVVLILNEFTDPRCMYTNLFASFRAQKIKFNVRTMALIFEKTIPMSPI